MLRRWSLALLITLVFAAPATAQEPATPPAPAGDGEAEADDEAKPRSSWLSLTDEQRAEVERFSAGYKKFMHAAKTELGFVREALALAKEAGFEPLDPAKTLKPGGRYYDVNRDRTISLIVAGTKAEPDDGFRVIAAHIDSPRLELKARPLSGSEGFALLQTNYHGGIKNYQWVNIPLALVGRVDKKDGSTIQVSVGNEPGDPVFIIPDLSPHVDRDFRDRKNRDVIAAEELDPIAGHIPGDAKRAAIKMVEAYLATELGIERDDLVSAELSLVPALAPRDVGFDRGLMAMYGQDDRLAGYTALRGALEPGTPARTTIYFLVDNEEVGSVNNTGARSTYLVDLMERVILKRLGDAYRAHQLRAALRVTRVLSVDVNPGVHPTWPSVWEKQNAPRLGFGPNLKFYGRGFDANSEYTAWIRRLLDDDGIPWQTTTYKVGKAGGGTIGGFLSDDNMEVIDLGVPLLSIHSPYAVSSKVDVYWLYRFMRAFRRAG